METSATHHWLFEASSVGNVPALLDGALPKQRLQGSLDALGRIVDAADRHLGLCKGNSRLGARDGAVKAVHCEVAVAVSMEGFVSAGLQRLLTVDLVAVALALIRA